VLFGGRIGPSGLEWTPFGRRGEDEQRMNRIDVEREQQGAHYLARLERLCHLEERFVSPPDTVLEPERLVSKAIFATYCTCVLFGRKAEAERLLASRTRGRAPLDAPPSAEASPMR
jgi:hypothetical protein